MHTLWPGASNDLIEPIDICKFTRLNLIGIRSKCTYKLSDISAKLIIESRRIVILNLFKMLIIL
jgi:hypothetical protein